MTTVRYIGFNPFGVDIESAEIKDDTIVNADIKTTAAILISKLEDLDSTKMIVGSSANVPTERDITGDVTFSNTGVTAIASGVIVDGDVGSSAAIAYSKLAALTDGNWLMGNASNVAVSVTPSGDVTFSNTGVAAIASGVIIDGDIKSDAAIAYSKLAALTDGNWLMGDASNVAVSVTPSGDVTFSNTGVATIGNDKVTEAMMANNAIGLAELKGGTDGEIYTFDTSGNPAFVTVGTSGQVLTSNGAGAAPTMQTASSGNGTLELAPLFNNWGSSRPAGWREEKTTGPTVTYDTTLAIACGTTASRSANVGFFMDLGFVMYRIVYKLSEDPVTNSVFFAGLAAYEGGANIATGDMQNVMVYEMQPTFTKARTQNAGTSTIGNDIAPADQTVNHNYDILWEENAVEYFIDDTTKTTTTTNLPIQRKISFFAACGSSASVPATSVILTVTSFEAR